VLRWKDGEWLAFGDEATIIPRAKTSAEIATTRSGM
jgi:hypothetical protein